MLAISPEQMPLYLQMIAALTIRPILRWGVWTSGRQTFRAAPISRTAVIFWWSADQSSDAAIGSQMASTSSIVIDSAVFLVKKT
jgi:hypothetical protein